MLRENDKFSCFWGSWKKAPEGLGQGLGQLKIAAAAKGAARGQKPEAGAAPGTYS